MVSLVYAGTAPSKIQGCWSGETSSGKVELVLSKDKKVADGLWFDDGQTRLLADLSCSNKIPVTCALGDDGGKFELRPVDKIRMRMKFRGRIASDTAGEEPRIVIRKGPEDATINLVKMSELRCREETRKLFELFGVGP